MASAAAEEEVAQCRFCLEDAPIKDLIAPCKCAGTGHFVHVACLREWQRQVGNDERASTCQTCRTPFSLQPLVVKRRSSRQESLGHPIFLTVSTNPYFDRAAVGQLSRDLLRRLSAFLCPGSLILRHPAAPQPIIRGEDWNCGIYLIGAICLEQGSSQPDALIATNLVGTPILHPEPLLQDDDWPSLDTEIRPIRVVHMRGGPVQPRRVLVLIAFDGQLAAPLPALVRLVPPRPAREGEPRCGGGALFGELAHMLPVLRAERGIRVLHAMAFWGYAVWSGQQLLSEVARGHWGLTAAAHSDLMMPEVQSFEQRRAVWAEHWASRSPAVAGASGGSGRSPSSRTSSCAIC